MDHWLRLRRVDPSGGGFSRRGGRFINEAGTVLPERAVERVLACREDGIGLAEVHLVRCHQPDSDMVVLPVVPIEEAAAESPGILDAAKTLGEPGLVFQGLVGLRVRVVVGCVRAAMRLDDPEACHRA